MILTKLEPGVQRAVSGPVGKEGCYFLCLLKMCVDEADIESIYSIAVAKRLIGKDCTVYEYGVPFLKDRTSATYFVTKYATKGEIPQEVWDDSRYRMIVEWYNFETNYTHFTLVETANDFRVNSKSGLWDPLGDSRTVKEGTIKSIRVYKRF